MDVKLPKNCKENRYYYKHREEILEKRKQKRMEDPEYLAKQKEKEDKKKQKEEENKDKIKEKGRARAKIKAELLGILPIVSSGVKILGCEIVAPQLKE
jgi:hypothetical protein